MPENHNQPAVADALNALLAEHAGRGGATLLTSHQPLTLHAPLPRGFDLDRHGRA